MALKAILFDSGNTLIFPQLTDLTAELVTEGYHVKLSDFDAADRAAKEKLDSWLLPRMTRPRLTMCPEMVYWTEYMRVLMEPLDCSWSARGRFLCRVVRKFKNISFWSRVAAGTGAFLEDLRLQGYRMGVISNATGKMQQQLSYLGLARYFDFVLDSHVVGLKKPGAAIFQMGLNALEVRPAEALFVGDCYAIDIAGAERAGIRGVLMDTTGAYAHRERAIGCERVTSLEELGQIVTRPSRLAVPAYTEEAYA